MAIARATCTCAECGKEFKKETKKRNCMEAESWSEWASKHFHQCPDCWAKEKHEIEANKPIELHLGCDPYGRSIVFYFSGNTTAKKDQIKALGYRWGDKPVSETLDLLALKRPPFCWSKIIESTNLSEDSKAEINKALTITDKVVNHISILDIKMWEKSQKEENYKQAARNKINKPIVPSIITGKRWNGKIYGKFIYLDGEKILIDEQQLKELEEYLKERERYNREVEKL